MSSLDKVLNRVLLLTTLQISDVHLPQLQRIDFRTEIRSHQAYRKRRKTTKGVIVFGGKSIHRFENKETKK